MESPSQDVEEKCPNSPGIGEPGPEDAHEMSDPDPGKRGGMLGDQSPASGKMDKVPKLEPDSASDESDPEVSSESEFEPEFDQELSERVNFPYFHPRKPEMFHFSWPDYPGHLRNMFETLLDSEAYTDVTLMVDGDGNDDIVALKAHRIVLSASSPYFAGILEEHPGKSVMIVLKGYEAWEVGCLLDFMYRGKVTVDGVQKARELVKSAKELQIRGLAESLSNQSPDKDQPVPNGRPSVSPPALNLSQNSNKTPQRDPVPVPDSNSSSSPPKLGSMPRRKQARPRRRSGDYEDVDSPTIGQDLRLVSSKSRSCSSPDNSLEDESHLHEGQGHDRHHEGHSEFPFDLEEVGDCPMPNFPGNISIIPNMARFPFLGGQNEAPEPVRRRPGRPRRNVLVSEPPPHKRELPPDFGDGGRRRRSSRLNYGEEEEGGMENGNHIIDYTTVTNSGGLEKAGERERRKKGVAEDHLQQQHLAFLRNYNWAMAERGKLPGQEQECDRGGSPPPVGRSREKGHQGKQGSLFSHRPSHGIGPPLFDPHSFPFHLPRQLLPDHTHSNKGHSSPPGNIPGNPPNPGNFLSSSPSMSITPLGEDRHSPYSPLTLGGDESPGGKYKERGGSPGQLPWPPGVGPAPIFGRHRAQHSAPRGGPPRAWSNADLTEALHNVWNKKMTTSQASRIFGIPYNSLLMYVRGKYGKSLKLDVLKKGLDQAMENSQNIAAAAAKASSVANNVTSGRGRSSNNNNGSPKSPETRSPPSNVSVSALLQSLHNNNTIVAKGGSGEANNNVHGVKPGYKPNGDGSGPGFNPFFFGDFGGNPFPFASALQHILPPHLSQVAAAGLGHFAGGNGLPLGSSQGEERRGQTPGQVMEMD